MKKLLSLLILTLCLCLAVSCGKKDSDSDSNQNGQNGSSDNTNQEQPDNGKIRLIASDKISASLVDEIYSALLYDLGLDAVISSDTSAEGEYEIIIGETDRALSKKAYTLLSRIEKEDEDFDTSYLIYSDGKSVAVAFDEGTLGDTLARDAAIAALTEEILAGKSQMSFTEGVLKEETLNIIEKLDAEDAETEKAELDKLLQILGGDDLAKSTLEEIVKFRTFASPELIRWLANLYDPETGGFYYSNSGRNTIGYAPDIESTEQAFNLLSSSGALSAIGSSPANLPDWMKEALVNWIKPMQDTNGYFYHPQWGKELTDSRFARRGRDLWRAENLLRWCGVSPTYTTPNGTKGDFTLVDGTKVNPDGTPVSEVNLTGKLSSSPSSAVAKISSLKATSSNYPSHMKDEASFLAYLNTFDIKHDSYYAGNEIASQAKEIANRESQLKAENSSFSIKATLEKWLNDSQNPENGLWYYVNAGADNYSIYDGVNGLLKISALYNEVGIEFPNPMAAIDSAIRAIYTDEDPLTVCYTYNTWFAVKNIFDNLTMFSSNPEQTEKDIAEIRASLLADAPNAIKITREKVAKFLKDDGSFSYYQKKTSHGSMGMPVAVPNVNEGDINATLICGISTAGYMYQVLGIEEYMPSLYGRSTWYKFLSIIDDIGDVIKNEIKDDKVLVFDDYDDGQTPDEIIFDYKYSSGGATVTSDVGEGRRGKALRFNSPADGGDRIQIDCTNPLSTNSYVFETDMCIESGGSSGYCIQIVMGDCYMLAFRIVGNRVQIFDTSSASTIKKEVEFGYSVGLDEWFKLRMEYYVGDEDTVRAKVYINDKLIAVSDNYYNHSGTKITQGHGTPATVFTFVRISAFSNYNVSMLFDNMAVYKRNDIYEVETNPLNQPIYTVDRPTLEENIFDFEDSGNEKDYPDGIEVFEGGDSVSVENGELLLNGGASDGFKVTLPHFIREEGANCDVFEAFVTLKNADEEAKIALNFLSGDYTETEILGLLLESVKEGDSSYLAVRSYPDGALGDAIDGLKIPQGERVKIKVEYYTDAKAALIYLNGKLLAFVDSVSAGAGSFEIGRLDISDLSVGNISISLDDIKFDREKCDFKASTTPDIDRVTHDFASQVGGGVEINAGEISGGKLNLANGGSISIPLNHRSVAINTILLSLDITLSADSSGDTAYITLADAQGKSVLAYVIKSENGTATLHELTKNGIYGKVATLTLGKTETLTLEYFRGANQVNIYLGDKCVMVSSLVYCETSALTLPERAAIEVKSLTALDNIVYEGYAKLVETPEISAENPETDKADFESSGKGILHSALEITDFTNYSVKESLLGSSYTKILEFVTTRGKKDSFSLGITSENAKKLYTAYETKIYVRHDGGSSAYAFNVALKDADGNDAYKFIFRIGDAGMQMWDIADENGETKIIAKRDVWFTLRLEYYHELGRVITYVNGEEVYNSANLCSRVTDKISLVSFTADEGLNATLFLDDMSLSEETEKNEPTDPTPDEPEEPIVPDGTVNPDTEGVENAEDNANILTFESSENGNFPNALTMRLANSQSSISIEELVRSENNKKVMVLKTVKGNKDEIKLSLTENTEEYNAFVFESDLYVKHDGGSSSYSFTVNLTDAEGNAVYKFILRIGDAGMQMWDVAAVSGSTKVIAQRDQWFTLRVEYVLTDGGAKALTYVNGLLQYESENVISVSEISGMSFIPDEGLNATVKFDNLSLSEKTVVIEEEEEPVEDEPGPVLGFENGAVSSKVTPTLQSGTLTVEEYKDHKAMVLTTADGSLDQIKINHTTETLDGYTMTVFEADLLLFHVGPSSAYNENVTLTDKNGNEVYKFTLRHANAGVYMEAKGQSGAVIAQRWVWFSLRLEYRHLAEGDTVTVLVNGNIVYESSLATSAEGIGGVIIAPDKGIASKLYIDNLALYTAKEEN